MEINLTSIPNAMEKRVGLPRPDWTVIVEWVIAHTREDDFDQAWTTLARQWLDLLRGALLPVEYGIEESDRFFLLSSEGADRNGQLLYWCESFRDKILTTLPGVARDEGYGKHVVLSLHNHRTYYNYVADFFPEQGEFGGSGGMFIDSGYGHFVLCAKYGDVLNHTIAHELTHAMIRHLPLPLWLNEGVTQLVDGSVTGRSYFLMDPETAGKHRTYWTDETIQSFWSGESFLAPDEGQELSYSLAQVLVRNLMSDFPKQVLEFLNAANYEDAGEEALQTVCRASLSDRVAQFLGPGDWFPRWHAEGTES